MSIKGECNAMAKARDDVRPDGNDRRPTPAADEAGSAVGPPFFLAAHQGGFRGARIYRGYPDAEGISFVYGGPAVLFLDLEVARGRGAGGWQVRATDSLKTGVVGAAGLLLVILGILVVIGGRLALRSAANATDFLGLAVVFVVVFGVAAIVALTSAVRRITRRAAVLDAMSPEQIRAEADSEKMSFRVTAENVKNVRIDPEDTVGVQIKSVALLLFRHEPTGKWRLALLTHKDARLAARAFRQVLGKDAVEVNVALKKD
jgi:hypothetical protein